MRISTLAAIALALAAVLAGTIPAQAKLRVVASFSILADLTARVGGPDADVNALVGPDGDAHVFEPRPQDAALVKDADVMVVNGLGFEGWFGRLVKAAGFAGKVVTASDGITLLTLEGADDPHGWQSPLNAIRYVANIRDGLCAAAPAQCDGFRARAAAYAAELEALDRDLAGRFGAVAADRRRIVTSHDAFGYLAQRYGITISSVQGVSTEAEASAGDVAGLIRQIKAEKARVIFVENISDPRLMDMIARETGAKLGGELYSDALSPADGPAPDYVSLMRHNAGLLLGAMTAQ